MATFIYKDFEKLQTDKKKDSCLSSYLSGKGSARNST